MTMKPCYHESATEKFEAHYQTHPLVGSQSQFRCATCNEAVKIDHKDYEPGGPNAIRLVPLATLKKTVAAKPAAVVPAAPVSKPKGKKKGKR